jgi:hypothetical protein
MAAARTFQWKVLLSPEEHKMVGELAEARGLTPSDYIRALLRMERSALEALRGKRVEPTHFSNMATLAMVTGKAPK